MKNQLLLERICKLIAQTYAVPLDWIFQRAQEIGVDAVITILENQTDNTPKF